jgi:predicted nucleic acid-binding protein
MAVYFIDSSALAKRYVTETGTHWVQALTDSAAGNSLYVARITLVELVSAISRRRKNGDLTLAAATAALTDVRADFISSYQVIEVTVGLIEQAQALAEKHPPRVRCSPACRGTGGQRRLHGRGSVARNNRLSRSRSERGQHGRRGGRRRSEYTLTNFINNRSRLKTHEVPALSEGKA